MTDEIYWALIEEHLDYALEQIKQLEKRIIQLEVELSKKRLVMNGEDAWYWDH